MRGSIGGGSLSGLALAAALLLAVAACGGGSGPAPDAVQFDVGGNDRTALLAFGDGITAGTGSSDGAGYAPSLERLLAEAGRPSLRVVNEGREGSSSADGAARIREALARVRPAALLLLYGASDESLTALQPPLVPPGGTLTENLRSMIEAARAADTLVVISTLPPVCGEGRLYRRERTSAANESIRSLAREAGAGDLGVVLVDAWADFLREAPPDGCGLLGPAGNLPTDAGHAVLARSFAGGLQYLAW